MNRDDAASLVNRIVSTWPTGPKGHIWTEVLLELELGAAEQAYRRLRAEHERAPAVATFLGFYRAARTDSQRDADDYIADTEPDDPPIALSEYLRRLEARVADGDPQAADEQATWHRYLNPKKNRGWTWRRPSEEA